MEWQNVITVMLKRSGRRVEQEEEEEEEVVVCACNVMRETTEQKEAVGAGRAKRRRGREGERSGKGRR